MVPFWPKIAIPGRLAHTTNRSFPNVGHTLQSIVAKILSGLGLANFRKR